MSFICSFEQGVTVAAKPGEFQGQTDCLFTIDNVTNITLYGYGVSWLMQKSDYSNASLYNKSEHRHGLAIYDSSFITIYNVAIAQTGGDGVYISGVDAPNYASSHITLSHVTCADNYRQGLSVISVDDLVVDSCSFRVTNGTSPQAGVDLEPNSAKQSLSRVRFVGCTAKGNTGNGFQFWLGKFDSTTKPVDVYFSECHVDGGQSSAYAVGGVKSGLRGQIVFNNCTAQGTTGAGLAFSAKSADSVDVLVQGGSFINVATSNSTAISPIELVVRSSKFTTGNLTIDGLAISDDIKRPFLAGGGEGGVANLRLTNVSVFNEFGCSYNLSKPQSNVDVTFACNTRDRL